MSDNFLAHVSPLDLLVEAAGRADEAAVSLYAEVGEIIENLDKESILVCAGVHRARAEAGGGGGAGGEHGGGPGRGQDGQAGRRTGRHALQTGAVR